jgi:hypothetical protein
MLPYILAAVGGYLIGDSMKKQYADGGMMADSGEIFVGIFDESRFGVFNMPSGIYQSNQRRNRKDG